MKQLNMKQIQKKIKKIIIVGVLLIETAKFVNYKRNNLFINKEN